MSTSLTYRERLTSENIDRMLEGVDVIVDGTDNFPTRYLLNDASLRHRIPVVHASIFRFEGQLTVFKPYDGPVLPLPLPAAAPARARAVVRRGRRARRAAGHHGLAAGERGAQAAARHRRVAGRPPDPVRRARHDVPRGAAAPRPRLPRLRRRRRARSSTSTTRSSACLPRGRRSDGQLPSAPRPAPHGRWRAHRRGRRRRASAPRSTTSPSSTPRCARACSATTARSPSFVNVYVEGEDVRVRGGLDTPLTENANIIVLPAMAGGSTV